MTADTLLDAKRRHHHRILETLIIIKSFSKLNKKAIKPRKLRARNTIRDRSYGLKVMADATDAEFQRMFRLSRKSFGKLHDLVAPYLEKDKFQATRSSGSPISTVTKLAVTLRWLAGGSYLDICSLFGIDKANFFNGQSVLWQTIDAIDRSIQIGLSLSKIDLRRNAQEFSRMSNYRMNDCVMAVDGWVCKTRQPSVSEVGGSS